jgi:hypothetical protein
MKAINLGIDLTGINLGDDVTDKTPRVIGAKVITNVIQVYGIQNKGLTEDERRKYYKISDAFEAMTTDEVQLEDDWFGFIKKAFKEGKLQPDNLLRRVEEKVLEVKDR